MRNLKNKNVLITGGLGFIGSNMVRYLLSQKEVSKIIILDNLFVGKKSNLSDIEQEVVMIIDNAESYHVIEALIREHEVDIVFNLATKALNYSFANPHDAFKTNIDVALNLLELLRQNAYESLCHFSTSEVYGTAIYEPMDERHPMVPLTTYAAGKAAVDMAINSYVEMFDIDVVICRPFNNYGPYQNHEGPLAGVIPQTVKRLLNGDGPVINGSGLQSRDFIFVRDTVELAIEVFKKGVKGKSYNISSDSQTTISDLVNILKSQIKADVDVIYQKRRVADVDAHKASSSALMSLIGKDFEFTSLESGLDETISWYSKILKQ